MIEYPEKEKYTLEDLQRLMTLLRSPGGCAWDREQTHESIRRNLIEEAYEAAGAIDEGDRDHLLEELGDVLLQVVFHSELEREQGSFDLSDVADGTCRKLLRRHPHVFGAESASTGDGALDLWEAAKRRERKDQTLTGSMEAVTESLPALWRAEKLQKKAEKAGLPAMSGAEVASVLRAAADRAEAGEADGDGIGALLFASVSAARNCGTDPEAALHTACEDFIARCRDREENGEMR